MIGQNQGYKRNQKNSESRPSFRKQPDQTKSIITGNIQNNSKQVSSLKWRGHLPLQKASSKYDQMACNDEILHERSFKKNWDAFRLQTAKHIKFEMMIPIPISQTGNKMLKDGYFIVWWLKILQTSEFINIKAICEMAYRKFYKELEIGKATFQDYFKQLKNISMKANEDTEMQIENNEEQNSLKRDRRFVEQKSKKEECGMQIEHPGKVFESEDSCQLEKHSANTSEEVMNDYILTFSHRF